jgi:regulator of sigma E protease
MELITQYLINPLFDIVIPIGLIVIGFGFLIFVHELGHFLVAKLVGIKTTQFAIGFGHSLLTWRKGIGFRNGTTEPEYEKLLKDGTDPATLGETEYRLNYIPLGGYVKMLGQEDMDPTARSEDPRAFNNKSVSARFAVISAGVIMNLIFGMIFFVVAFMSGVKFPPAIVGGIAPGSPASKAYAQGHEDDPAYLGLQLDDQVTHVDGEEIGDMMDLKSATILASPGTPLVMTINRPSEPGVLTYPIVPETNKQSGLFWIGVNPPTSLKLGKIEKDSPAYQAGLRKGMSITAVNGQPVQTYTQYEAIVSASINRHITITFSDAKTKNNIDISVSTIPLLTSRDDAPRNLLGLVPPLKINEVLKKGPSVDVGFQVGDIVASIQNNDWPDFTAFVKVIKDANREPIFITVLRDGQEVKVGPITPNKKNQIGVAIGPATDSNIIGNTLPGSPVNNTNIMQGSRLTSINGQAVESWADLQQALTQIEPKEFPAQVIVGYELNITGNPSEQATITLTAEDAKRIADAGWLAELPDGLSLMMLQVSVVGDSPMQAVALGFTKTKQFITQTYTLLTRLFQQTVPANVVSGPVGIVHQGTIIAERGWQYLLYFLGLISINLAVINFLPIPITDGGQAIFLAIEKLKGSPVSVQVQTVATLIGLALLGCVFLFVTYNDFSRLLGGS